MGSPEESIFLKGRRKLTLSRNFIRRRELAQFIRKTGPKTIQLQSEDRITREAKPPSLTTSGQKTLQLRGIKPEKQLRWVGLGRQTSTTQLKRPGGMDWDINTHRPEQLKQLCSVHDTSQLRSVGLGRRPHTTAKLKNPSSSLLSSSTPFKTGKN
jgi:hypothetical protein